MAIPTIAIQLPFLAVSGEFINLSARMKLTAASRYPASIHSELKSHPLCGAA